MEEWETQESTPNYCKWKENNQESSHCKKNPFVKYTEKCPNSDYNQTDDDILEEGILTNRVKYNEIQCPNLENFYETNKNNNNIFFDSKVNSNNIEEVTSPINKGGINDNDLGIFASIFKDKICLSDYVIKQFQLLSSLPPISLDDIQKSSIEIPLPKNKKLTNKTLVLDLDNTLVNVVTSQIFYSNSIPKELEVLTIDYFESRRKQHIELKVIIRPYLRELLTQLSPYFEIIVFTAASKSYGDAVMNALDPEGNLIDYRLYRENCTKNNDVYVKDLRIINRDLKSTIIVDDLIVSFASQMENGIFIAPFTGKKLDGELGTLRIFLRQIVSEVDVRVPIAAKYNLLFFYKMYSLQS